MIADRRQWDQIKNRCGWLALFAAKKRGFRWELFEYRRENSIRMIDPRRISLHFSPKRRFGTNCSSAVDGRPCRDSHGPRGNLGKIKAWDTLPIGFASSVLQYMRITACASCPRPFLQSCPASLSSRNRSDRNRELRRHTPISAPIESWRRIALRKLVQNTQPWLIPAIASSDQEQAWPLPIF